MADNFEEKVKKSFKIKVTYQNSIGKKYEDLYAIDFSQFIGLRHLGEPPLYKISKNIEKIQKDIHHLSTGFYKMKVIRYTKEDVEKETEQLIESADKSEEENEK